MEFQAETKQLLDIVTNSLYTDKEVFLRELISNASDALEKLRHVQATNRIPTLLQKEEVVDGTDKATTTTTMTTTTTPLEIRIDTDEVTSTITITDTGIGMTEQDMIENLGTIARSGSKNFIQELQRQASSETAAAGLDVARGIIGKFGVGFYSVFMIATKVEVRSKSAILDEQGNEVPAVVWTSEGTGTYEIGPLPPELRHP